MLIRNLALATLTLVVFVGGVTLVGYSQMAPTNPTTQPAAWTSSNPDSPIAPGAKLEKFAGGLAFTEGCTSNDKGDIYFIDQPNDRIMLWSTDHKLSTWMQPSCHANGMCFAPDGNLIVCADELNQLWSITPDKKITVLVKDYQGKLLNGPNDVWVRPDGAMYITDPLYKRDWWPKSRGQEMLQDKQAVYFISPDAKTITRVIDDFTKPNGIIGTPDGKTLYVSDIAGGKTFSYTIHPDGPLSDKKLFANIGSDGMTIDSDGNIYTTSKNAVQISDKNGKLLDSIPAHGANVCFGGADGHLLFITARTEIFGLRMKTHRVGPQ